MSFGNNSKIKSKEPSLFLRLFRIKLCEDLMHFYILNHARRKRWNYLGKHVWHQVFHGFWHEVRELFSHVVRHGDSSFHGFEHIRNNFWHETRVPRRVRIILFSGLLKAQIRFLLSYLLASLYLINLIIRIIKNLVTSASIPK